LLTFESGAEVFDAYEGGKELPVKGRVVPFSFLKFVTEKSEWLPMALYLLLQDPAHVGVGGVGGEREHRAWEGCASGMAVTRAALAASEAAARVGDHGRSFGFPARAVVSGSSVSALLGRKQW
jgi:hypothetical protein